MECVPSTSVHLPDDLLRRLDEVARRRRISRNRLIVEACRSMIGDGGSEWPQDFFAADRLTRKDRELLRSTFDAWQADIRSARRSKRDGPF
jgi:predicted transcriptional regulator